VQCKCPCTSCIQEGQGTRQMPCTGWMQEVEQAEEEGAGPAAEPDLEKTAEAHVATLLSGESRQGTGPL